MTSNEQKTIGKIIRVEWDQETDEVRIVMEITDPVFKKRVLYSKDLQDVVTIQGKDVMIIASNSKNETNP